MFIRGAFVVWATLASAFTSPLVLAAPKASEPKQPPAPKAPKVVLTLKRGETKEVQLCWDEASSGMGEAFFLGADSVLPEEKKKDETGTPRFERAGVVAEVDTKQSTALQTELYKSGQFTGKKKGESYRHIKALVVRVTVDKDAELGTRSIFVHIRHYYHAVGMYPPMFLEGEFRLLVRE
jgi:hypothetical protein